MNKSGIQFFILFQALLKYQLCLEYTYSLPSGRP